MSTKAKATMHTRHHRHNGRWKRPCGHRRKRANIKNLKQGNADLDTVIAAQARYLNTLSQYKDFSKKMKLPEQMERVYMDGLGRMAGRRTVQIAPRRYKDNEKNFTTFDGRSPQKGRGYYKAS